MATNECLNDRLSAVLKSVDKLEIKGRSLQAMYDDMRILVNAQERRIWDLDNKVNFYSQSLVKLEGKKAERVRDRINSLEQRIAGQDDQIKVLLHRLVTAEEGRCCCRESCHDQYLGKTRFTRSAKKFVTSNIRSRTKTTMY